ncbi:hypothetical protein GCM10025773_33290 [Microbacterium jejuense]
MPGVIGQYALSMSDVKSAGSSVMTSSPCGIEVAVPAGDSGIALHAVNTAAPQAIAAVARNARDLASMR